jgi:hypothetical protein
MPPIQPILLNFSRRLDAVDARDPALAAGAAAYHWNRMAVRRFPRLRSRFCAAMGAWQDSGFDEAHAPVTRQQVARVDRSLREARLAATRIRRASRRLRQLGVDAATANAFLDDHLLDPAIPRSLRG